jgi:methylthioribulose-1-phosphate dehydratase
MTPESHDPAGAAPAGDAAALADISHRFYARGWVLGTSGNFSVVASRDPLRLAITGSGHDKRTLGPADIVIVDEEGRLVSDGGGRPSAETLLHVLLAQRRGAGAILHTHSVWSTILSEAHAAVGGLAIEGYEMLKGLHGVTTHEHREWIPILDNDQDIPRLARVADAALVEHPGAHALLLRRHGMYTWGDTLADAERHVEILEFLFEAQGRLLGRMFEGRPL